MKIYENTIEKFLEDLASSSPAPGGGAVAALSGALAASLSSMVMNLTVNKKKYMEYSDDVKNRFNEYLVKCEELRKSLWSILSRMLRHLIWLCRHIKCQRIQRSKRRKERGLYRGHY
ncbi:cyclodeaminase/cyclohydrolase family protein [Caloramator sp. mosi_1]|nr:cyclodeaminase/cyclohydrolase family protein [Caloramator sp. mosi_1]WDC84160.1 cyclodeaminase/cyclohydrolase family protein [Caloramator sp. mosi_1]